jgi:hypothetical protein
MPIVATVAAVDIKLVYRLTKPRPAGPSSTASTLVRTRPIRILITEEPPMMDELFSMRR